MKKSCRAVRHSSVFVVVGVWRVGSGVVGSASVALLLLRSSVARALEARIDAGLLATPSLRWSALQVFTVGTNRKNTHAIVQNKGEDPRLRMQMDRVGASSLAANAAPVEVFKNPYHDFAACARSRRVGD